MRLYCIVPIVFFPDVLGQWGGFGALDPLDDLDPLDPLDPLEPLAPLEALTDNSKLWMDKLSTNGETWNIFCCTSDGRAVQETCGGNGVDCCDACYWHGGRSTDCLAFLWGDNLWEQANQHCQRAYSNPNYCKYSGKKKREAESNHTITKRNGFACASSPAVDAQACRRIRYKNQIRKMQCPCCFVKQTAKKICGSENPDYCPC